MATLKRSPDHSIWFKHIVDPTGELPLRLRELAAGQAVVLRLGNSTGLWVRFNSQRNGKLPEALRCGDENSKQIWHAIPSDGSAIEVALVEVLPPATVPPVQLARASRPAFSLAALPTKVEGKVLCVAVDVAWWGGQTGSGRQETRTETIAYVARDEDGRWSNLSLKRVDLNDSYNPKADEFTPNADAKAKKLTDGIGEVLDAYRGFPVVLAVDMPILAMDEGMPPARKANKEGEEGGEYRQCDSAWKRLRDESAREWKRVNILPGAPIVPRVRALIEKLCGLQFGIHGRCTSEQTRVVFECFPNEVAWSVGVLGFAEGLTIDSLQLYKRIGKKRTPLPRDLFDGVWRHPVEAAFNTASVDRTTSSCWVENVRQWLTKDGVFDEGTQTGQTGKKFDDVIDSVLSLSTAVAYAMGTAHIHQGSNPEDGHIIGPGITASGTRLAKSQ